MTSNKVARLRIISKVRGIGINYGGNAAWLVLAAGIFYLMATK